MEQQIAELLRQNQELILVLQIRDHSSSHKCKIVPVTEKFAGPPDIPFDQTLDKLKVTNHEKENCKFISGKCNFCGKIGHIKKACFASKKANAKLVKQKQVILLDEVEDKNRIPLYELKTQDCVLHEEEPKRPPIIINLKIENKSCSMELDTGERIDSKGLHKTNEKISAVVNASVPKNVHEVKSFLGLVNFYGKFCENLATIANTLNNLTKKNIRFLWSKDCQVAFEQIKKEICSPKVLVHYDPSLPLTLASDASPVGIGCVLSHVYPDGSEHPITFASRTLSGSEKKYSQIDKEALSIVWAVKKFYLYLKCRRFTLITDHKPLVAIFGSKRGLPVLAATRLYIMR
ncbi:transposon Tf2-9 polyprotein [Trichonephila clavata]|uniref:RNA-directed DNA polymerase n=1 Tax=Trichonephila clavata TaxID=2740835 RepID=A0A8X6G4D6_TRICU|nr:transposon Tf2-9 polyprotein [Trichonephila clavata]